MPIAAIQRKNVAELVAWCRDNPTVDLIEQALFDSSCVNWIEGVITLINYLPVDEALTSQIVSFPALIALQINSLEMARRLIQAGANPSLVATSGDWENYNALQIAVYRNDKVAIAKYITFHDAKEVETALAHKGAAELTPLMMALKYGYLEIAALLVAKSDPAVVYESTGWKGYNILQHVTYIKQEGFILALADHPRFDAALKATNPDNETAHAIAVGKGLKSELTDFLKPSNAGRLKQSAIMELLRSNLPAAEMPVDFNAALVLITTSDSFAKLDFGSRGNWLHLLAQLQYHPSISIEQLQNAVKKVLQFYHPYRLARGRSLFIDLALQDPFKLSTIVRPSNFVGADEQITRMNTFIRSVIDNPATENHFLLLSGPPGVGKTALIEEMARRTGLKLMPYPRSGEGDEYVGVLVRRVHDFFESAKAKSLDQPVCLFVDEIDALLPEIHGVASAGHFNHDEVVTQFQMEIDKLKGFKVILLGATNYLDKIKPAIKRRAGISVIFSLPTLDDRERLIQDFLRFTSLENNTSIIQRLAHATPGWSPSDLKKFIESVLAEHRIAGGVPPLQDLRIERHFEAARAEMERPRPGHIAMIAPRLSVPAVEEPLIALDRKIAEVRDGVSDFIADPGSYTRVIPGYTANVLLYGYPGTGKTALARAVVKQSNCCCFIVDASKITGITEVFVKAKGCERAIIFVDEFDKFACDESPVRELFQVEMDGFARNGGTVVVIAATNYLDRIAEPMLSRFNFKVEAPLPNRENRARLFTAFLQDIRARDADIFDASLNAEIESGCRTLAARREGLSIRDIESLVKTLSAAQIAKRNLGRRAARAIAEEPVGVESLLNKFSRMIDEFRLPMPLEIAYPRLFRPAHEAAARVQAVLGGAAANEDPERRRSPDLRIN